ncbi:MAG TPA: glycosyltransferase family 39 protein [Actinomycetota bacterium]|nr:glycosyltransferase family 39 protein [Actinomycetota bacterium]
MAILLAFALIWFANLDSRRLVHPDEGRYAEIPREMAVTGDWVTPRLDGLKYFEKPALQYWITAAAYKAFGIHPWTARLWPALAGFLGVMFIGYVGSRLGGATLGLYSAAALGGCLWYSGNAHILTLDAGLTLWMTIGLGAFFIAQRAAEPAHRRAWMWTAWSALALATLSKGLIGIVLPGAALITYSIATRDWALWRRLHLVSGFVVFLAIAGPWFVVVSVSNPGFFDFFFVHEHFTRFLTSEHRRTGAWWYFVPILLVGLLPWVVVFFATLPRTWMLAPQETNGFSWPRFALVWSAVIFVFFSASGSKLPSYILPIFPALALTIGWQLATLSEATLARLTLPLVVAFAALTIGALVGYPAIVARIADARQPAGPLLAYGPWIQAGLGLSVVGGAAGWWWLRSGRRTTAVLTVALSALAGAQVVLTGYDELAESRSTEPILARIASAHGPLRTDLPFYAVRMYDQTLPYYLGRTVVLVDYRDELAFGIENEPDKAIGTIAEWQRRWGASDQAYAMMQPDEYERLKALEVPMVELGRDPRRVVVSRR